jgi:deoxyribodipyrimidine photo-lyase
MESMVKKERIRLLNKAESFSPGGVLYWMSRDQRIEDNHALLYAKELAEKNATFYSIIFNIVPEFLGATIRQYDFMLRGLEELEKKMCRKKLQSLYDLTKVSLRLCKKQKKNISQSTQVLINDSISMR